MNEQSEYFQKGIWSLMTRYPDPLLLILQAGHPLPAATYGPAADRCEVQE